MSLGALRRSLGIVALSTCLVSAVAHTQQTRNDRLRAAFQAYDDLDAAQAQTLLRAALNPAEGPADSLWQRGVQLLAQILVEENREAEARAWLRWGFRVAPAMVVDTVAFLPQVVTAAREAQAASRQPNPGDPVTRTSWEWSAPGAPAGQGRVRVTSPRVTVPVNALVQGVGVVQSGGAINAPAGTYGIQVAAEGYLPTSVTREVLPGITTVLEFNLVSAAAATIAEAVRSRAFGQLVPLNVQRYQSPAACATGAYVSRDGLVITTYQAIRGSDAIEVQLAPDRTVRDDVRVAAWDTASNLAVIQLPVVRTDSLVAATQYPASGYAWALGLRDCRTAADTRTRIPAVPTTARLELADSVSPQENAGPVIDSEGRLVGVHVSGRQAVAFSAVRAVIEQARQRAAQRQTLTPAQLALQMRHAYGAVAITADVTGTTARITPLESWQWPETARSGPLPLTFAGPMGRYQLEVTFPGQAARRQEFTVRAGALERLALRATPVVAEGERQVPGAQPRRGGGAPIPLIVLGAGGAAAGAFLLLGKKAPQNGGNGGNGDTGGITVTVPNPSVSLPGLFRLLLGLPQ
ncbi:MAG TPA: serine protease [Gemmatimonadales bacterium]|nr:serine protease [Gemmatimonadales bacterium]